VSSIIKLPDFTVGLMTRTLVNPINYGKLLHNIPAAWAESRGAGVKVGVIDTGLPEHRDLKNQIDAAKNFTSSPLEDTVVGHSTHVCGIIAAAGEGDGVTGIAPEARLVVAKALSDAGSGNDTQIAQAIDWCVAQGCQIINMSLGAPHTAERGLRATRAAVIRAFNAGVTLCCASGNESQKHCGLPAAWIECIAVGAVDQNKKHANFSNSGPELDCAAAGVDIMSTFLKNTYAALSGTSMATPQVAGICTLILSAHLGNPNKETPIKNGLDMLAHLESICIDVGDAGCDIDFGWGIPVFGHVDPRPKPLKPPPKPRHWWMPWRRH
jgi:subtilisin family serine protease